MKQMKSHQRTIPQTMYEEPKIDIIQFSCADIITTSGNLDDNQGEWDPQVIDNIIVEGE